MAPFATAPTTVGIEFVKSVLTGGPDAGGQLGEGFVNGAAYAFANDRVVNPDMPADFGRCVDEAVSTNVVAQHDVHGTA